MIEHEKTSIKLSFETLCYLGPVSGAATASEPLLANIDPDSTLVRTFETLG
jgi:hypothetical protein